MTMRTTIKLVCSCGHEGLIKRSENDQPYSKAWESYSLENLNGGSFRIDGGASLEEVFKKLKPICPQCNKSLGQSSISNEN